VKAAKMGRKSKQTEPSGIIIHKKRSMLVVGISDYVFPEEIADINNKDEIRRKINSVRQRKSRKIIWGIINEIGLMRFFSSNFIVACQK